MPSRKHSAFRLSLFALAGLSLLLCAPIPPAAHAETVEHTPTPTGAEMPVSTADSGIDEKALLAAREAGSWSAVRDLARAAGVDPEALRNTPAQEAGNDMPEVGSRLNMDAIYDVEGLLKADAERNPHAIDAGPDAGTEAGLSGLPLLSITTDAVGTAIAEPVGLEQAIGSGAGRENGGRP